VFGVAQPFGAEVGEQSALPVAMVARMRQASGSVSGSAAAEPGSSSRTCGYSSA
jgi:hypothetical protein